MLWHESPSLRIGLKSPVQKHPSPSDPYMVSRMEPSCDGRRQHSADVPGRRDMLRYAKRGILVSHEESKVALPLLYSFQDAGYKSKHPTSANWRRGSPSSGHSALRRRGTPSGVSQSALGSYTPSYPSTQDQYIPTISFWIRRLGSRKRVSGTWFCALPSEHHRPPPAHP